MWNYCITGFRKPLSFVRSHWRRGCLLLGIFLIVTYGLIYIKAGRYAEDESLGVGIGVVMVITALFPSNRKRDS